MTEVKCCHQVLPVTRIRLSHDVMSARVWHGRGPQQWKKKKKSRDFLDILPTLRLKYTQCTKAFCGAQRWTEPVACGGVGVGKLWWQSSERRYRPVKLNPPLAERCPGRVLDVKCSRSVKLFLHETQSIPPSSLQFGLIWSCQLRLKSLSLKAFLYHT